MGPVSHGGYFAILIRPCPLQKFPIILKLLISDAFRRA